MRLLIAREHLELSRARHLDDLRRDGLLAGLQLLRRTETTHPRQERDGERGRVVILPVRHDLPRSLLHLEVFRLSDEPDGLGRVLRGREGGSGEGGGGEEGGESHVMLVAVLVTGAQN